MPQNMKMERKMGKETKNQPNGAGTGMNKGLAIGMGSCIAIGIALSEIWGYHDIIPYSIVFGSTVGMVIGFAFEKRYQKSNG